MTRTGADQEVTLERTPFVPERHLCAVPGCGVPLLFGRYFACDPHRARIPEAVLRVLWIEYDELAARGKRAPTSAYAAAARDALAAIAKSEG